MSDNHHQQINKATLAGMLVAVGIVFGDIGTSPLYTFSAIVGDREISETLIIGGLSAVFWTLTIQTTLKYVLIVLSADNKGEGGIFSLYALIKRYSGKWIIYPAILGCSFILTEGIITPPLSVSSAVEGLRIYSPDLPTIPIVIVILIGIFSFQQFGTQTIGKLFGPVMMVWFLFLATMGIMSLTNDFTVLKAVNPIWVYRFLVEYPGGFWLLGAVFLCTTGAEALYSDMGHCGRSNIRFSWIFVKVCLLLNYAGQAAWLISHGGEKLGNTTPFYSIVPKPILPFAIGIATLAAIIASQALISGSFTLIGEAMRFHFWYRQKIAYPTDFKGQLYIPQINWMMLAGCIGMVLYFHESKYMEAAYGLSVTLTMMMTTTLLSVFLIIKRVPMPLVILLIALFLTVESAFLVANLLKFTHGGWVTFVGGLIIASMMWIWYSARKLRQQFRIMEKTEAFFDTLKELSNDRSVPQYATHLVYLTASDTPNYIEQESIRSVIEKTPKRADVYWFIHVKTDTEPFTMKYKVETLAKEDVYFITFTLGFRIEPRMSYFFNLALQDLIKNNEVEMTSRHPALKKYNIRGDIRFVVMRTFLSYENHLPFKQEWILRVYYFLRRRLSISEDEAYGLDADSVVIEKVPLIVARQDDLQLVRET